MRMDQNMLNLVSRDLMQSVLMGFPPSETVGDELQGIWRFLLYLD